MNKQKLTEIFDAHIPETQMSEDETLAMFNILMSDDPNLTCDIDEIDKSTEVYETMKPLINAFQAQVFLKRLKALTTLKMSLGALIILMFHMESAGNAVMYAWYLQYKLPENTLITVDTFADVFPFGFFSKEQLNTIWNAQKDSNGNIIDKLENWK